VTLLDEHAPTWHFRERHSLDVNAPPRRVLEAVRAVTLADAPIAGLLVRLRGIRAAADKPILDQAAAWQVLADDPDREFVVGSIGQPWKLRGGTSPRADFATFDEPGYAKMALSFRSDGKMLSTETRVLLTDEASRRAFRRYWIVIRPFSGLIRRLWLRAARRRLRT
jgi:hypothetical protein